MERRTRTMLAKAVMEDRNIPGEAFNSALPRRKHLAHFAAMSTGAIAIGAIACALYIDCARTLHDARFLTGWILMLAIFSMTLPGKRSPLTVFVAPGAARVHRIVGFLTLVFFGYHIGLRTPNSPMEIVLTTLFITAAVSGGFVMALQAAMLRSQSSGSSFLEAAGDRRLELQRRAESIRKSAAHPGVSSQIRSLAGQLVSRYAAPQSAGAALSHAGGDRLDPLAMRIAVLSDSSQNEDQANLASMQSLLSHENEINTQSRLERAMRLSLFVHVPVVYSLLTLGAMHGVLLHAHGYLAHLFLGK